MMHSYTATYQKRHPLCPENSLLRMLSAKKDPSASRITHGSLDKRKSSFSSPGTQPAIDITRPPRKEHRPRQPTITKEMMSVPAAPESIFYPSNPHTKTNEEIDEDIDNTTFWSGPGIAPICSFPIEHDHPIVPRWHGICQGTIEILKKGEIAWIAIECFRRRQHPRRTEDIPEDTTIVITVNEVPQMTDELKIILHEIYLLSGMFSSRLAILLTSANTIH